MENTVKSTATKAAGAAALVMGVGVAGLFGSAIANASASHEAKNPKVVTPSAQLAASAGEQVRTTGTQGTITTGTQGTIATADQCTDTSTVKVACITPSLESVPQNWAAK